MSNNLTLLIDIGTQLTKIVYIKNVKDEITILNFDMFKTPDNVISDEEAHVNTTTEFVALVKKSLAKMQAKAKEVYLCIPNTGIITRETNLPIVPDKQLEKMIEMEIPNHFLVNLNEFVIDYKIAEKRPDQEGDMQYIVFMSAVPQKVVESYIDLMSACGLDTVKIDFYGNSISKLAGVLYQGEPDDTIAILDIGNIKTNISIVRGKALKYSRSIFFGGYDFDSIVAEEGKNLQDVYDNFDMLNLMRDYEGPLSPLEEKFSALANGFVSEVMRILEFYMSREKNNNINKIVITGGFSALNNFERYLSREFDTTAEMIAPVSAFKIQQREEEFQNYRIFYTNCLGAAL